MTSTILLVPREGAGPAQVGDLTPLEVVLGERIGDQRDAWTLEGTQEGWLASGSFLLSGASLRAESLGEGLTKLRVDAVIRQGGPLTTGPFKLRHEPSGRVIEIAATQLGQENAAVPEIGQKPPEWLLPPVPIGGWNVVLLALLGALLFALLAWLGRALYRRLAARALARLNHKDRALKELANLHRYARAKSLQQNEWKKFSFELAGILRRYSDENFGMDSRDMTDREFVEELRRQRGPREQAESISAILSTITEVRYGTKMLEITRVAGLLQDAKHYVERSYLSADGGTKT